MRRLILAATCLITISSPAQNNTGHNIIEGSKTLVELVRVLKMPKYPTTQSPVVEKVDSCAAKNVTDVCIKNSTANPLLVSLYKRNGNGYDAGVLLLKILPRNQEVLYELKVGIYKIKFETEEDDEPRTINEGEIKLIACRNVFKEIK